MNKTKNTKKNPFNKMGLTFVLISALAFSNCQKEKRTCFITVPSVSTADNGQKTRNAAPVPLGKIEKKECDDLTHTSIVLSLATPYPSQVIITNSSGATATKAGFYRDASCTDPVVEVQNLATGESSRYLDITGGIYHFGYFRDGGASVCNESRSVSPSFNACMLDLRFSGGSGPSVSLTGSGCRAN